MIKLFVDGFPREMDDPALRTLFSDFGEVTTVKLVKDQQTGESKSCAFVGFLEDASSTMAINVLNNSQLNGRTLNVKIADRPARSRITVVRPISELRYEKVRQSNWQINFNRLTMYTIRQHLFIC